MTTLPWGGTEGVGWRREDVFVSNAVLCNPRDAGGRNDTPTSAEMTPVTSPGSCDASRRVTIMPKA